jgi:transcriptional regulator of acetoin/glycerol metabolism
MRDRWVGLEVGVDTLKWARLLRRAHEAALRNGQAPSIVRGVIAASWERCTETGLDPGGPGAPLMIDPGDARERWREHPLSRTTELLRSVLGDLLHDARHIVVVSDADGCLLWSEGHPDVLRASEGIRFCPGHMWSESAAGTNAVGTALAADHAVQVFSAEHFRAAVHGWQCSGAPVHDPDTGRPLGVIDVTGTYRTAHPHNLALVQLAARLVEEQLRREMLERDARILGLFAEHTARHGGPAAALSPSGRVLAATPSTWTKDRDEPGTVAHELGEGLLLVPESSRGRKLRRTLFRLTTLGCDRATLATPHGSRRLTARHSEIAVLLALHPEGLDSRELARLLYDEPGHEVSARAELHRLREVFGPALATRPYRLVDTEVDLAVVQALLDDGRPADARARYPGALLPGSPVPAIAGARRLLAHRMRSAAA